MTLDLLGFTEIATLAGIKPASVARYHQTGRMPPPDYTVSRVPMWKRATVDRWLASKRAPGRPPGSKNKPRASSREPVSAISHSQTTTPALEHFAPSESIPGAIINNAEQMMPVALDGIATHDASSLANSTNLPSSTEPVVCTTPCGRCLPTSTETGVKRCRWEGAEYVEP